MAIFTKPYQNADCFSFIVQCRLGFGSLLSVLVQAFKQSQDGKGYRRHGRHSSFESQPIMTITRSVGLGFPLGQALKKIQEVTTADFTAEQKRDELLGAIVYLAAAILHLETANDTK